ncbi:hypothetical protein PEC106568_07190 [Pectobacterium carotovorum subsp. carotovorum]|nr:hypothetical protein PEC106568_07190 [Pectobacterium carotovorum subsp. carotovorum]
MLTPAEVTEYQKSCNLRACVVGYEDQSLCANCNADLHQFELHVCDSCAIELLDAERARSENDG